MYVFLLFIPSFQPLNLFMIPWHLKQQFFFPITTFRLHIIKIKKLKHGYSQQKKKETCIMSKNKTKQRQARKKHTLIPIVSFTARPLTASSNASNNWLPTISPAPTSKVVGSSLALLLSSTSPCSFRHFQCTVTMSPSTARNGPDAAYYRLLNVMYIQSLPYWSEIQRFLYRKRSKMYLLCK